MMDERDDVPSRDGHFMRVAEAVGDLGSPFYREERQRDVWNEATAVGLQVAIWLGLAVGAGALWIGGRAAVPYALTMLVMVGVVSMVTSTYAQRLGVRPDPRSFTFARAVPLLVLLLVLAGGFVRAALARWPWGWSEVDATFLIGVGVPLGLVAAASGLVVDVVGGQRAGERRGDTSG